jgi:hypothetical protein
MKACHVIPSQNIKIISPPKTVNSLEDKSTGIVLRRWVDEPKRTFIQLRKKKVGAIKYSKTVKKRQRRGKRSKKKLKKRISATNMIDPGNPKKIKQFTNATKNNLGQRKLIPLISVIRRVLKRRPIASTSKNELVESRAWLINIQKLANIKADCPLITQIVSQCISTTVEYATSFFKSI